MTWHRPGYGWCRGVMPRRTLDCPRGGGGGGDRTRIGHTAGSLWARGGGLGGTPGTSVPGAARPAGGGVALALSGLRPARPGRGRLRVAQSAQVAGGLLRAAGQSHRAFHRGADTPGTGGAFGGGVGLGEQAAGDDPAGGGVIPVHRQVAARAVRPLPAALVKPVRGRMVSEIAECEPPAASPCPRTDASLSADSWSRCPGSRRLRVRGRPRGAGCNRMRQRRVRWCSVQSSSLGAAPDRDCTRSCSSLWPRRQYPQNVTARRSMPRSWMRWRRSARMVPASPAIHA